MKRLIIVLSLLFFITGCCDLCSCIDEEYQEDSIFFRFQLDSLNGGFIRTDLDTVYLICLATDSVPSCVGHDTIISKDTIINGQFTIKKDTILVEDNIPDSAMIDLVNNTFRIGESKTDYSRHDYKIYIPAVNKEFLITDIEVEGQDVKDKCCECYYNRKKYFKLDGKTIDRSGSRAVVPLVK
jgi:hypothetical protein